MTKNTTILSQKESLLIENLIAKYGIIVDFDRIRNELDENYSRQQVRNLVAKMTRNGWLVRIKKGVYYIANLESRGFAGASALVIAQTIMADSYVSFEAALEHHGIFDQHVAAVTSVCLKKRADKNIQGITYRFVKTSKKNFYGWEEARMEGRKVKVATPEKAILDMIHFQRSVHALDVALEKLEDYKNNFDLGKLAEMAKGQSVVVQKILGFFFDKAGIDSGSIHELTKSKEGTSKMTKDSDVFSAKWNLYYHNYFAEHK